MPPPSTKLAHNEWSAVLKIEGRLSPPSAYRGWIRPKWSVSSDAFSEIVRRNLSTCSIRLLSLLRHNFHEGAMQCFLESIVTIRISQGILPVLTSYCATVSVLGNLSQIPGGVTSLYTCKDRRNSGKKIPKTKKKKSGIAQCLNSG